MLVSAAARLRVFSGSVREVEAGDDCVRDRGRCTPNPLPAPPLLHNMGTAKVSICRCSCCSCFCCSHNNDYRKWQKLEYKSQRRQSNKSYHFCLLHHESERNYVTLAFVLLSSVSQIVLKACKNHCEQEYARVPSTGLLLE